MTGYRFIAFAIAFLGCGVLASNAAEFFRLSDYVPGIQYSRVTDVSADGTTVVGEYRMSPPGTSGDRSRAFVWELGGPVVTLMPLDPAFPNAEPDAYAYRVTTDGSKVMGDVSAPNSPGATFLWTQADGFTYLDLPQSFADMTADGTQIVGSGSGPFYVWTQGEGVAVYGPPAGYVAWGVRGISDNGDYVTGSVLDDNGLVQGFRWDFEGEIDLLPILAPLDNDSRNQGWDVSDGGVVAAEGTTTDGFASYRWTEQGGVELLGELQSAPYSSNPLDITPNGSIIVGGTSIFSPSDAYLWVEGIGNRSIKHILERSGYDMSEWQIGASAVSDNGRVVVGAGVNPDGNREGWVVVLDASEVPEPSSVLLAAVGLACVAICSRRRRK